MKYFENPKQNLELNVIVSILLSLAFVVLVSCIIYLVPIDSIFIGSIIKAIVLGVGFWFLFRTFKLYDKRYMYFLGTTTFITLLFLPYLFDWILVIWPENIQISFFEYVNVIVSNTKISVGFTFSEGSANYFSFIIYTVLQVIMYFAISFSVVFLIGNHPYSERHRKYYEDYQTIQFNQFKKEHDYLENINDTSFQTVKKLLNDPLRFNQEEETNTESLKIFVLGEEENIIIEIKDKHFLLDKKESKFVLDRIEIITTEDPLKGYDNLCTNCGNPIKETDVKCNKCKKLLAVDGAVKKIK